MHGRLQGILGGIVLFAVFGLGVWGFIEAIRAEPAVVGSIGVAGVGVLGVVWQQRQSERARLREAHRDRMTPVYYDLLGAFKKLSTQEGQVDPEIQELFMDLKSRQLLLGASSDMVRAFNEWQGKTEALQEERQPNSGSTRLGRAAARDPERPWPPGCAVARR
jgi:hypothetical protein